MSRYLLIESRDCFESSDVAQFCKLAAELAAAGNAVTMLLVQNAVLPVRRGARSSALCELAAQGVQLLADEFSLRERAIAPHQLVAGVEPSGLEVVIDQMAAGTKTLWH